LLSDQLDVVGIAPDGRALIAHAKKLKPDLIVAEIAMPLLNGLDAAEQIRLSIPGMRFVFLTMMDNPNIAAAALRFSPVGYVLKHSAATELLIAIKEVLKGKSFVTARLKPENWAVQQERAENLSKELTPRQRDVLQLLAEGRAMKEVADILQISEKTVEFHKYNTMKTWNLRSNADLVLFAEEHGLVYV
jgi:DNA-binding NarL/FixJ family response regulator